MTTAGRAGSATPRRPGRRGTVAALLPIAALVVAVSALPAFGQSVIGQYEDEAPLLSWNGFGAVTAPRLGLGLVSVSRAFDASAGTSNPALLTRLPRATASASAFLGTASLYRYAIVNTGPVTSAGPISATAYGAELGGVSARWRGWTAALTAALVEDYGRPAIDLSYDDPQGRLAYALKFDQTGFLRAWHVAVAHPLGRRLAAGVGVGILEGEIRRNLVENFASDAAVISDSRTQSLTGAFANAGLTWDPLPGVTAALSVRSPFVLSSRSRSSLEFRETGGPTSFTIAGNAEDRYRRPWAVAAGASWTVSPPLTFSVEAAWFGWSRYRMTYFGEDLPRKFRDVVRAGAGGEYGVGFRMFGRRFRAPLRAGVVLDPQPTLPRSSYLFVTIGAGLRTGRLAVDGGAMLGRDRGSGRRLSGTRFALTLTYDIAS